MIDALEHTSAQSHFPRSGGSGAHGHTHRMGVFQHRQFADQRQQIWFEAGCQCSLEPTYMSSPDWQNGFIAGRVYDDNPDNPFPRFDFSPAQVHNCKLTWEGQILRA